MATCPPEHADLVTERGVFDDEFSSGTQADICNDLERFNPAVAANGASY
jgi:hypothetical protein